MQALRLLRLPVLLLGGSLLPLPVLGQGIPITPDHLLAGCETLEFPVECHNANVGPAGDVVVAEYVDPFTKNTARLIARDEGLFCGWEAEKNPYVDAGFIPAYYAVQCYVRNPSNPNNPKIGANSENAGAAGELQVTQIIPKANLQWTILVKAVDVRTTHHTTQQTTTSTAEEWWVEGEMGAEAGLKLKLDFVGPFPIPGGSVNVGGHSNLQGGYRNTQTTTVVTTTEVTVTEQHAQMLGVQNFYVTLVPKITRLEWTNGKTWGCDALDLVEDVVGEREIASYTIRFTSEGAPEGELKVKLGDSELKEITNQGGFNQALKDEHGFKANYWGQMPFDSTITFDVNYEYPESWASIIGLSMDIAIGGQQHHLDVDVTPTEQGVRATLVGTTLPAQELAAYAGIVTRDLLVTMGGDLSLALVNVFLKDPAKVTGVNVLNSPCAPSIGLDFAEHQAWSATGTIQGFSTGVAKVKGLDVDVYLDPAWAG